MKATAEVSGTPHSHTYKRTAAKNSRYFRLAPTNIETRELRALHACDSRRRMALLPQAPLQATPFILCVVPADVD